MPVGKRRPFAKNKKVVTEEGFEPSPPKRLVPETSALDRSAIQPMPLPVTSRWIHESGFFSKKKECAGRESNPGLVRGRDVYYHCTTGA